MHIFEQVILFKVSEVHGYLVTYARGLVSHKDYLFLRLAAKMGKSLQSGSPNEPPRPVESKQSINRICVSRTCRPV